MEITGFFILAALFFGFFAAAILCYEFVAAAKLIKRKQQAITHTTSQSAMTHLLQQGVRLFMPISRGLLRWEPFAFIDDKLRTFIQQVPYLGVRNTQPPALLSILCLWFVICLAFSVVFCQSPLLGGCIFVCSILGILMVHRRNEDRKVEEMREAIPEALQTMKTCFFAGYSLPQTFEQLVKETKGTLKELFQKALSILNTGGTLDEALTSIQKSSKEPELIFLAAALEIQHKTGSSIEHVLDATRQTISDEIDLKRSLRTQTAQAKLSAQIVTLMPFVLIILFSLISEGFLSAFFESPAGIALLVVALTMQIAGVVLVRKLLKVEVV